MSHKDIQPQIKFYSSKDISSKNYEVPASQSLLFLYRNAGSSIIVPINMP